MRFADQTHQPGDKVSQTVGALALKFSTARAE